MRFYVFQINFHIITPHIRKEKEKTSRETLGKYFYDLSKLSFTALFLGGGVSLVLDFQNINYWVLVSFGAFTSFIFAYIGYKILKK